MAEFSITEHYKKHEKSLDSNASKKIVSVVPKIRQDLLKWNGWGYKDSGFAVINLDKVIFQGNRYPGICGELSLPLLKSWVLDRFNVNLTQKNVIKEMPKTYPPPVECLEFVHAVQRKNIDCSDRGEDRFIRCHGQTLREMYTVKLNAFKRIPDLVIWPTNTSEVEEIVKLANVHNVVLIPFGGGTSVTGATSCPENETRTIAILDTSQMNKMLWLDRDNLAACFEGGIVGQDLERELKSMGFTTGHEPDSMEFSTLGGWVATRASGMKKNLYGNIEDLVIRVKMVTCKGVLEKHIPASRVSCGPDFNHLILGSEGTLGVITEVVVKIRPLPQVMQYGSIVFPNFEQGVKCLREIAKRRLQPASIRLMDHDQFILGQILRPMEGWFQEMIDKLKQFYVNYIKKFNFDEIVVATLVFEGNAAEVKVHEKAINEIAAQFLGFPAGAANGLKGYTLTFIVSYVRDIGIEYGILADSFETSVPWDKVTALCKNVKIRVEKECAKRNVKYFMITCRVTQTYDYCAACYFYFSFNTNGFEDPIDLYEEIEEMAREEVLANGGSLSHHHGVGKIRKHLYPKSVSDVGVGLYKAAKHELDPNNIFAVGNLMDVDKRDGEVNHLVSKL